VDDVSANVHGKITSDGAWSGFAWLGGTEELSAFNGSIGSLPDHGEDWGGLHEVYEAIEEWLALEIGVMSLKVGLRWLNKLHSQELEPLLLESLDYWSNETTLDAVWLYHDECLVVVVSHY